MNVAPLERLAERFHEEAETLRRRGAESQAVALESAAADLERAVTNWLREPLSVDKASAESGYSAEHLRRLVREGKLPNAGPKGSIRIRRIHLPSKPGSNVDGSATDARIGSRTQMARSVVESERGDDDGER